MSIRQINLTVGNSIVGHGVTWSYKIDDGARYSIPIYALEVKGKDDSDKSQTRSFDVFRFGVTRASANSAARVVGLADEQTYTIEAWLPKYVVHSAVTTEKGAWQVFKNYLIHDGPDDPDSRNNAYATLGCLEICRGPAGFDIFNDFIISLSGSKKSSRDEKLAEIGKSGKMVIKYLKAARPPLAVL
jgi:hypothetical protein